MLSAIYAGQFIEEVSVILTKVDAGSLVAYICMCEMRRSYS